MRINRIPIPEEITDEQSEIDLSLMEGLIEKYRNKKGNLIPLLQGTQDIYGYLPHSAFLKLNRDTELELNDMYGVATFYAQFRLQPAGKFMIKVCHGTACHVQNVQVITDTLLDYLKTEDGGTTEDGLFTIETVACLGCCSLAPAMMIDDDTYGKLDSKKALKIVKEFKRNESGK